MACIWANSAWNDSNMLKDQVITPLAHFASWRSPSIRLLSRMSEGSLATPEVKKKITYLLGKRSSFVFICFARVLYALKDRNRLSYP